MKIIHIPRRFDSTSWGGTEQVVWETGHIQNELGHDARVFCPDSRRGVRDEDVRGLPARHFPYFFPFLGLTAEERARMDKKGGNIFSFSLLRGLRKEKGIDLLHLHTLKRTGGIGRFIARRRGVPYVVSLHGGLYDVPEGEQADLVRPIEGKFEWGRALGWMVGARRVLDDAAAVICVGKREAELVRERHPAVRVVHMPNGVDASRFADGSGERFRQRLDLAKGDRILLQVGRIDRQKNQLQVVRALPRVLERCGAARAVFVGPVTSKPYADEVRQAAAQLGVAERVHFAGSLDPSSTELADAYNAADAVVMPSLHEPFGIAILEAWAAGRPVVASRVGGIPGFAEDGEDALLVEPDNDEDFAAAVSEILTVDDPSRPHAIATAGREKAETRYSWREITGRLIGLYEEVRDANPDAE